MKNGQATIETLILFAAFLTMLLIFLSIAVDQIQQNIENDQKMQMSQSLNSLKSEIQNVYFLGVGSVREIYVDFPQSVNFEKSFIEDKYLIINIFDSDLAINTGVNIKGDWPNSPGNHKITIVAYNNYVGINIHLLDFYPKAINQTINQGFSKDINLEVKNVSNNLKNYYLLINFESELANVESIFNEQELVFEKNEIKEIPIKLFCSNNASGNYFGEIIFISDINAILPINITCVSSQKNLTIFPKNIQIEFEGESVVKEFLVCNNSKTDLIINNVNIVGNLREIVLFDFSGKINSNSCRVLNLTILEHEYGNYFGELVINASGLVDSASIEIIYD